MTILVTVTEFFEEASCAIGYDFQDVLRELGLTSEYYTVRVVDYFHIEFVPEDIHFQEVKF